MHSMRCSRNWAVINTRGSTSARRSSRRPRFYALLKEKVAQEATSTDPEAELTHSKLARLVVGGDG